MKKKSTLDKLTPFVVGTCMLTLVASCGSDDDDSSSSSTQAEQQEGVFSGTLTPVNSQIADGGTTGASSAATAASAAAATSTTGDTGASAATTTGDTGASAASTGGLSALMAVGGTVTITQVADDFQAMVDATEATSASHPQFIYTGSRCPTTGDDANGDGYVDVVEAMTASGQMLVPLDSDLRSQESGGNFPSGSNYSYDESTSYQAMLADLRAVDEDTTDSIVKLGANEELNLGSRVVIIHGVPSSTTLPPTVQGINGLSPQQTLPIACAVLSFTGSGATTGTTTGDTGASAATTTGDTGASAATTTGDTGASAATTTGDTGASAATTGTTTGM